MVLRLLIFLLALSILSIQVYSQSFLTPNPLVIWHGLGDSAENEGLIEFKESLEHNFPGLFVHLVEVAPGKSQDQRAGIFGNVNEQIQLVADQLRAVPQLNHGFDAVGFSQGGQFLRALIQRQDFKVRNLITFGSQHQGISDFPACKPADLLCRLAESALRGGVFTEYSQHHLVSAQYYRDPRDESRYERYLQVNEFIADINNEKSYNSTYAENLSKLENFVMIQFDKDITVQPKASSWFSSYPLYNSTNGTSADFGKNPKEETVPLRQSDIYKQERLGLKAMDQRKGLKMLLCKGVHMQIDAACQSQIFGVYAGTPRSLVPFSIRKFFFSKGFSPDWVSTPFISILFIVLIGYWIGSLIGGLVLMMVRFVYARRSRGVELEGEERLIRAAENSGHQRVDQAPDVDKVRELA